MFPSILRNATIVEPPLVYLTVLLALLVAGWAWLTWRRLGRHQALRARYQQDAAAVPADPAFVGKPDQPSAVDTLGYGAVADAVAGLLQNKATGAPYSVVVSGNWGSGKSSVMLQVQEALEKKDAGVEFKAIWINVWHYQSGQHLLAAFLRKLLKACDTPPYRRRFRFFRFRTLGFWNGLQLGITVFLLGPALLYFTWLLVEPLFPDSLAVDLDRFSGWLEQSSGLGHVLVAPFRLLSNAPDLLKGNPLPANADATAPKLPLWGTVLAWAGTLLAGLRALRTDGDVVRELVPLRQFEQAAARADAGFRDQYREQLRDVLQYAPPATRLVFFVDDVDRIPGPRVLELLESLNFMVEACRDARREAIREARLTTPSASENIDNGARLYFVLGMYVPEVVRGLGAALSENQTPTPTEGEAQRHAAQYLEKLVDLVVPMPTLTQCAPEQIARLLFGDEAPTQPGAPAQPEAPVTPVPA